MGRKFVDDRAGGFATLIAYDAFFSIFPAIALAFTVFGLVLRDQPQILDQIKNYLNDLLPGSSRRVPTAARGSSRSKCRPAPR